MIYLERGFIEKLPAAPALSAGGLERARVRVHDNRLLAFLPSASRRPADAKVTHRNAVKHNVSLPFTFVPNAGQTDPRVAYYAQAAGASSYFTPREALFSFSKGRKQQAVRLTFLGAQPAVRIEGAVSRNGVSRKL